jgi:hypothetical protein
MRRNNNNTDGINNGITETNSGNIRHRHNAGDHPAKRRPFCLPHQQPAEEAEWDGKEAADPEKAAMDHFEKKTMASHKC